MGKEPRPPNGDGIDDEIPDVGGGGIRLADDGGIRGACTGGKKVDADAVVELGLNVGWTGTG